MTHTSGNEKDRKGIFLFVSLWVARYLKSIKCVMSVFHKRTLNWMSTHFFNTLYRFRDKRRLSETKFHLRLETDKPR